MALDSVSVLAMPNVKEGGRQRRRRLPQKVMVSACMRGTIDTHIALAFVAVTVADWVGTGHIEQNPAPEAFRRLMRL